MQDLTGLIDELDTRMRKDGTKLVYWRHFHRFTAISWSLILIIAPSALAVGLTSSESLPGKILLLAIAVVGGMTATFKPYTLSYKRRADANAMHRLRDEFRAEVARVQSGGDADATIEVYRKYSNIFSNIYELRGKELMEATLSVMEQRELAGRSTSDEPLP